MEKLELKHISPYIPYGLEILTDYRSAKLANSPSTIYDVTNKGIDKQLLHDLKMGVCKIVGLRPLSDLTKEIEHNGERFMPIEMLAKIELTESVFNRIARHSIFNNNNDEIFEYFFNDCRFAFKYSKKWNCFQLSKWGGDIGVKRNIFVFEQLALLNKLYEWHFAVNIPEHLYINKNSI